MTAENDSSFALTIMNGALMQKHAINDVLACSETTSAYGLTLTEQQAAALVETQSDSLKKTGRIEFGGSVINNLILAFCDSPYISQQNYEETLHGLIELFYNFKNETSDLISDNELIEYMKKNFNGSCCGSLELLSGRELPDLARKLNAGSSADFFEDMEKTDGGY